MDERTGCSAMTNWAFHSDRAEKAEARVKELEEAIENHYHTHQQTSFPQYGPADLQLWRMIGK